MTQGNPEHKSWKKKLFDGLVVLAGSGFLYWYLTDFENSHEEGRRISWVVALLYSYGGKWLVCSLFLIVGIVMVVMALRQRSQEV